MDTNNEILDAIEILADRKISENITKVLTGICKSVNINNNTCVMDSNGVSSTVQFYGSPPEVNELYRIFVPSNNMSRSFIVVPPKFTVNPNLLDNWYFGNPVNQRGQTSYTGNGYTVDRWMIGTGSSGTLLLADSGLKLARTDDVMYLAHRILKTQIPGESALTYSVLTTSGLFSISFVIKNDTYHEQNVGGGISLGWNYTPAGFVEFTLVNNTVNSDVTILAAKLEFGPTQTLAHQENGVWVLNEIPDYGEQLRRCQRYFVRLGFSNTDYCIIGDGVARDSQNASIMVPLPTKMRTNYPVASLTGRIILRHSDVAIFVSTTAIIDAGGVGATLLKCVTSGLTTGDAVEAFLEPQNYLDLSADL